MYTLKVITEDSFLFKSLSNQVGRPVSPRGGLYLSGRAMQEDDSLISSIVSPSDQAFVAYASLNEAGVLMAEADNLIGNHPKYQNKSIESLQARYAGLARQNGFSFSGQVTVTLEKSEDDRVISTMRVRLIINKAADFLQVPALLAMHITYPDLTFAEVPYRVASALRV